MNIIYLCSAKKQSLEEKYVICLLKVKAVV